MSQIGLNHRLSVAKSYKQQTRNLYEGVLDANVTSPGAEIDIFTFTDGSGIGYSTANLARRSRPSST